MSPKNDCVGGYIVLGTMDFILDISSSLLLDVSSSFGVSI